MIMRPMTEQEKEDRKKLGIKVKKLQENNVCPTCYNFIHKDVYEDFTDRLLYEDDLLYCFLEKYPRNPGHTIILIKHHYEDISEMPEEVSYDVMKIIKVITLAMKEVICAEKVYVCTMCDGIRNHLHFQLIPRDKNSIIGSKVFVKERGMFVQDTNTINELRSFINNSIYDR